MAKFKKGDRIRMVEDKDFVATVEKVLTFGYVAYDERSRRCTISFYNESDWELETPSEHSTQTKEESIEREIEKKIEEYTTLGNCPHYDENASVCDDGDCGCAECISRIRRFEKQEAAKVMLSQCVPCGKEYQNVILHKSNIKESEPSTHEMKVTTQTEWHDVDSFCREHLKLDDGEVAKITIIKFTITK